MSHQHNTDQATQLLTVAAVAALVGAATALLVTPRTGKQVRGGLKRRATDVADQAKAHFSHDDLEEVVSAVQERLQTAADEAAKEAKTAAAKATKAKATVKTTAKRATKPRTSAK